MANIKISDLTAASVAADANEFEINEAGTSKKVTGSQIKAFVNSGDGALASKNTVATADIDNLAVTTAKLAADAVDGTKIADDAIDSEHIAADSIDSEHYAPGSVDATAIATDAVGATQLNVPGNGTAGQYLASDGDGTMTWTTLAAGGGTYHMDVYTNPGTWTKPANVTSLKTTVIGGGGGYPYTTNAQAPGNTSSFGAFSSATGGSKVGVAPDKPGVGSGGTFNYAGVFYRQDSTIRQGSEARYFSSAWINNNPTNPATNTNIVAPSGYGYGAKNGNGAGPTGGTAVEYLPAASVPGPVAVTIGNAGANGGTGPSPNYYSAGKGVVVVEWWD